MMIPNPPDKWKRWMREHVPKDALSSRQSLWATALLTRQALAELRWGDLAECGVYSGVHPMIMAYVCRALSERRMIWCFDSFQGVPKAGKRDTGAAATKFARPGAFGCRLSRAAANIERSGAADQMICYVQGWYGETMPRVSVGRLALLRLDSDVYESTKTSLEHLYPRLLPGAVVIAHDWDFDGVRAAIREYLGGEPTVIGVRGGAGTVYWRVE